MFNKKERVKRLTKSTDVISRIDALSALSQLHFFVSSYEPNSETFVRFDDAENAIFNVLPVNEVRLVHRARWIYNWDGWECSLCTTLNKNIPNYKGLNPYEIEGAQYCPFCGAKMCEKEREDNA